MDVKRLNYVTPIGATGYGVAGINILEEFDKADIDVACHVIGQPHLNSQDEADLIQKCAKKAQYFDYNAPCLKLWHQFDLAGRVGRGKYTAFPIFELNQFNDVEKHHLRYADNLVVPSQWAKNVVINELGDDISVDVAPLGVNRDIFYPSLSQKVGGEQDRYIFFTCGKWEIRKGHDVILDIFSKAFTKDDNVMLVLMTYNPFLSSEEHNEWARMYTDSPLGDKIRIHEPVQTQYNLANIMNQVDCGIFPARAEGWNLELLEMMAVGKPVITTNYSAHTEFCTSDNSYLVDIDEMEDAYDGKWFHNQGQWANIGEKQIDQCVEYMRYCYKNRPENPAGIKTSEQFSWKNTVDKLTSVIWSN